MQIIVDEEQKGLVNKLLELDIQLREEQIKAAKDVQKHAKTSEKYIPKIFKLLESLRREIK